MLTRDALGYLHARGSISTVELMAAREYQRLYDFVDEGHALTPPELGAARGSGGVSDGFAARLLLGKEKFREARAAAFQASPLGYHVLEVVAGGNVALTVAYPQRRAKERALLAMKLSLHALAQRWRM